MNEDELLPEELEEELREDQLAEARARDLERAQALGTYTPVEQVLALASEVERLRKLPGPLRPLAAVPEGQAQRVGHLAQ